MRKLMIVMLAGLSLQFLAVQVWASKRIALVIGNAAYQHAPGLANPLNDANDIGAALGRLGFKVTKLENADYDGMRRGLKAFTRAAATSEIALLFYAGHGIEVDKRNFLIPVDARLLSDREVEFETVSLDLVSRAVEGASGLGLVILDACRDNPFAAAMKRSGGKRSIGRGLARVEPSGETLVAYAAKGGSVAADGEGRNSPYSTALLAHVEEPGLEVGLMFRKVRDAVLKATGGHQEPFVYGSLSSKGFYFSAAPSSVPVTEPGKGTPVTGVAKSDEQLFWESVKGSPDPADVEAYLKQFPKGVFAALARNRLKRLSEQGVETRGGDMEALERSLGLKRAERRRIQIALAASGFDAGGKDGLFGPRTRKAIGKWQASTGKAETGYLDTEGAKTLLEVAPDTSGGAWAVAKNSACKLWNPDPEPRQTVSWTGSCEGGKATGQGNAVWDNNGFELRYSGGYREGRRHGRGSAKWWDGRTYEGEWRKDEQHGQGRATSTDGTLYEGEWRNGRKHGRGVRILRNGTRYEGEWRRGRMPDRGVIVWPRGDRYEGEWKDGKEHGRGTYVWPDGRRYEGEWKDGKKHGRGTVTYSNGSRYEGEYRGGKRHGRGTLTFADGGRWEGSFRDGKEHGDWVLYNKAGRKVAAGRANNGLW